MSTQTTLTTWRDFARMTGVELVSIDDSTTIDDVERDLALGAVYWRGR
jgi:L-arabinose isomerase